MLCEAVKVLKMGGINFGRVRIQLATTIAVVRLNLGEMSAKTLNVGNRSDGRTYEV